MSVYEELRAIITARVEAVPDVGRFHNRAVTYRDDAHFKNFYGIELDGQFQIRGWLLSLERAPADHYTLNSKTEVYTFVIRGYMGISYERDTEATFSGLVEAIVASLDAETEWAIASATVEEVPPPAVSALDTRMFGSILVHFARIELPVTVRRNYE